MEREIIQIEDGDWELLSLDEIRPHRERMQNAVLLDHDDEFVKLVTGKHDEGNLKDIGYNFSPSLLWLWIIQFRSLKCGQAMVSGKTGLSFDLNSPLTQKNLAIRGFTPVQIAMYYNAVDLLELFLNFGARPDVPCKNSESIADMKLPIDLLLSDLGKTIDWTPTQPVYALIFKLCDKHLIVPLKIISLLLHHSPVESAQKALYRYARQGKAIELAVLLYVDSAFELGKLAVWDCEDYKALRLFFGEQIIVLSEEERKLAKSGNMKLTECMIKKKEMISMLLLLETFQRNIFYGIGADASVEDLAFNLRFAGLEMNGEFKYILKEPSDYSTCPSNGKLNYLPSFLQPQGLLSTMPIVRKLSNEQNTALARFFHGKEGYSTAVPRFHRAVVNGNHFGAKAVKGANGRVHSASNFMRRTINDLVMKRIMRMRGA